MTTKLFLMATTSALCIGGAVASWASPLPDLQGGGCQKSPSPTSCAAMSVMARASAQKIADDGKASPSLVKYCIAYGDYEQIGYAMVGMCLAREIGAPRLDVIERLPGFDSMSDCDRRFGGHTSLDSALCYDGDLMGQDQVREALGSASGVEIARCTREVPARGDDGTNRGPLMALQHCLLSRRPAL